MNRVSPVQDEPTVIQTDLLSKYFGKDCAIDDLSWEVERGTIHGVLGPNGAGKTTLQKLLLGMDQPTSGSARVLGLDIVRESVAIRQHVAFVPEDKFVYEKMRVSHLVRFYSRFFPDWNQSFVSELLRRWEVPTEKKMGALSKGIRAKILLALSLGRQPRLLLMDEPTIDLDPASADEVFSILAQWVVERESTIVLSTHRMDEVERICDHVAIMKSGRIVTRGDLDDLRQGWRTIRVTGRVPETLTEWEGVRKVESNGRFTSIIVERGAEQVAARLREHGGESPEIVTMNLRSIYLTAIGHERGRLDDLLEILA